MPELGIKTIFYDINLFEFRRSTKHSNIATQGTNKQLLLSALHYNVKILD